MLPRRIALSASILTATALLTACDAIKSLLPGTGGLTATTGKLAGLLESGDTKAALEEFVAIAQNVSTKELVVATVAGEGKSRL